MKRVNGMAKAAAKSTSVRCAIYTRKSTEEGLEQEFNSLDAQRDAGEAFIASQRHEGWQCSPISYDDGGFTGGNMDRPALRRLMADIEAGHINCVVVYKVDRLSRSLLDFARMVQVFEKHNVSFVSVTQQFNTATSMGRLVLNVLLSFAQFERELVSERTRDKIAATRRKGKWAGGHPVLGYDVDPNGFKLRVNESEALRVRGIFELYLEHGSLLPVVQELSRRGWRSKSWTTRKVSPRGGQCFTRTSLHQVLTNVVYIGKVKYKSEVHHGEHEAILSSNLWQRVQALLKRNKNNGGVPVRNALGSLLKGLLRCSPCGCAMMPTHTSRGEKRYRYYVCSSAQKRGWQTCPSKAIPATAIEDVVIDKIRSIGRDAVLREEVMAEVERQREEAGKQRAAETKAIEKDLAAYHRQVREVSRELHAGAGDGKTLARLAELQERIAASERRQGELRSEDRPSTIDPDAATEALTAFDPIWSTLTPREQARVLHMLVEQASSDGAKGTVAITFRPTGITTLAHEWADQSTGATACR